MNRKRIPFYHERAIEPFIWDGHGDPKSRDGSSLLPFPNCLPKSVYEEFVESGADDANWFLQDESKEVIRIRSTGNNDSQETELFQMMSHYGFLVTQESERENAEKIMREFELQITNKRDEKYVYLVQPQSIDSVSIFDVMSVNIPKDVMEDLSKDKAILCLSFIQEGDNYPLFFPDLHKFCKKHSIPLKNFVFCSLMKI